MPFLQLTEATAENDEIQRQSTHMKKKTARVQAEMEDLKLLLEEEQSRNAELEKKQRRYKSLLVVVVTHWSIDGPYYAFRDHSLFIWGEGLWHLEE